MTKSEEEALKMLSRTVERAANEMGYKFVMILSDNEPAGYSKRSKPVYNATMLGNMDLETAVGFFESFVQAWEEDDYEMIDHLQQQH